VSFSSLFPRRFSMCFSLFTKDLFPWFRQAPVVACMPFRFFFSFFHVATCFLLARSSFEGSRSILRSTLPFFAFFLADSLSCPVFFRSLHRVARICLPRYPGSALSCQKAIPLSSAPGFRDFPSTNNFRSVVLRWRASSDSREVSGDRHYFFLQISHEGTDYSLVFKKCSATIHLRARHELSFQHTSVPCLLNLIWSSFSFP